MPTFLIEVHGNDGTSHRTVAKHYVEKKGYIVTDVRSAHQRCKHGYIVWEVEALDADAD